MMQPTNQNLSLKELYSLSFFLAFCSISYELLIANTLSITSGFSILWQSLTVGIYLAALGIGAFLSERSKKTHLFKKLMDVELGLALSASIFVPFSILLFIPALIYDGNNYTTKIPSFWLFTLPTILSQMITILVGIFSGYEIPLLIRLANRNEKTDHTRRILGYGYIGTLAGALLVSLILFPKLDSLYSMLTISSLNMLVCLYLTVRRVVRFRWTTGLAAGLFVLISLTTGLNKSRIEQAYLKTLYKYSFVPTRDLNFLTHLDELKNIRRIRSLYQYIDIIDYSDTGDNYQLLALNENYQFNTKYEKSYHESFVHIPFMLFDFIPENVLVLGAGDGLLIRELLQFDQIKSITQIELDPDMYKLAAKDPWLSELNQHALDNPRVNTIIQDAFYYLRTTDQKFDAVLIDFPYPYSYSTLRLYSYEFYHFVSKHVTDDGLIIFDGPVSPTTKLESKDDPFYKFNCMLMNTLQALSFKTIYPYEFDADSFVVLSKKERQPRFEFDENYPGTPKIITQEVIEDLKDQKFSYVEDEPAYINSIFKPVIIFTSKYTY